MTEPEATKGPKPVETTGSGPCDISPPPNVEAALGLEGTDGEERYGMPRDAKASEEHNGKAGTLL